MKERETSRCMRSWAEVIRHFNSWKAYSAPGKGRGVRGKGCEGSCHWPEVLNKAVIKVGKVQKPLELLNWSCLRPVNHSFHLDRIHLDPSTRVNGHMEPAPLSLYLQTWKKLGYHQSRQNKAVQHVPQHKVLEESLSIRETNSYYKVLMPTMDGH